MVSVNEVLARARNCRCELELAARRDESIARVTSISLIQSSTPYLPSAATPTSLWDQQAVTLERAVSSVVP